MVLASVPLATQAYSPGHKLNKMNRHVSPVLQNEECRLKSCDNLQCNLVGPCLQNCSCLDDFAHVIDLNIHLLWMKTIRCFKYNYWNCALVSTHKVRSSFFVFGQTFVVQLLTMKDNNVMFCWPASWYIRSTRNKRMRYLLSIYFNN
jgi:hypothetical protein